MKFIADEMLGRLAKWLRVLGYDTLYEKPVLDGSLVNRAFREQRILLTRDSRLVERKFLPKYVLIKSDRFTEQLKQIVGELKLKPDPEKYFSRCLLCNTEIKPIPKDDIKERVPPYVFKTRENFFYCSKCDKIFWSGTHVEMAVKKLRGII